MKHPRNFWWRFIKFDMPKAGDDLGIYYDNQRTKQYLYRDVLNILSGCIESAEERGYNPDHYRKEYSYIEGLLESARRVD